MITKATCIGVSGPSGSGKTTLTLALAKVLGVRVVPEGVLEWLANRGWPGPWSLTLDQQLELQRAYVERKQKQECVLGAGWISDRTTLDAIALLWLRSLRSMQPIDSHIVKTAFDCARRTYDVVLLLDWRRHWPKDEVSTGPANRHFEHDLMFLLCTLLDIPVIKVPSLDQNNSVQYTLRCLSDFEPSLSRGDQ